ncbi:MAG: DMT family transporter [Prevotella sp.]|nr:DMT family transporter [Prevotella sp.]
MIWILLAFMSASLLGFYDVFKKRALKENAVIPVLLFNTLFSSLIFLPFICLSHFGVIDGNSIFFCEEYGWEGHKYIIIKSCIVLSSWLLAYFGLKHLPLTIVGPINATRPVMVLVGAMIIFAERLNLWQWLGVLVALIGIELLKHTSKKEGINWFHDKWIYFVFLANVLGAISGLYDKYLMASPENGGVGLNKMAVQGWYNIYQLFMMTAMLLLLWWPTRKKTTPFHWHWSIPLVSIFLSMADFVYFYALGVDGAMISVVSMVRRGSVIVSFLCGAMIFREKNLRAKAFDLLLVLLSMLLLFIGSNQ